MAATVTICIILNESIFFFEKKKEKKLSFLKNFFEFWIFVVL